MIAWLCCALVFTGDLDLARDALLAKEPVRALAHLEPYARSHPQDSEVWRLLGHAHRDLDQLDAAAAAFEQALTLGGLNTEVLQAQLDIARRQGRTESILSGCRILLAMDPKDIAVREILADSLQSLGAHQEAELHYRQLLALDPASRFAHAGMARVLSEPGMAAWHLEIVWFLQPSDSTDLAVAIARLHRRAHDHQRADDWYAIAGEQAAVERAQLSLERGDPQKARQLLGKRDAPFLAGQIAWELSETDSAIAHYLAAEQQGLGTAELRRFLALTLATRDPTRAAPHVDAALADTPRDLDLLRTALTVALAGGDGDAARRHLATLVSWHGIDAVHPTVWAQLAARNEH